eukprot:CAMPEP_0167811960 /NCGR_PEP_ID=MMETSP0112_2-20121227/972_1 /TAXON_ID=91324 /ORGANISM="Lotharella globosa, Strain CCCM811" /LENGTH=98 /DNA_ID=CAMNT_0007710757 /DNA_START=236 /DNA_END=532 /DNA_ORIENTATION=+
MNFFGSSSLGIRAHRKKANKSLLKLNTIAKPNKAIAKESACTAPSLSPLPDSAPSDIHVAKMRIEITVSTSRNRAVAVTFLKRLQMVELASFDLRKTE